VFREKEFSNLDLHSFGADCCGSAALAGLEAFE
jgi:hypothetical protein